MAEATEAVKKPSRSEFSVATLIVLGVTSTVAQLAAAASLGAWEYFSTGASTGGVFALVGSIFMGVKCRSWAFWKKWIWAWIGAMVVFAFLAINLNHQLDDRASNEQQQLDQTAQACDEAEVQLDAQAAQISDLQAKAEASVAEELRRITERSVPGSGGFFAGQYEREVEGRVVEWSVEEYEQRYGSLGGQEAEQEYEALYAEYMESC